ncbi:MULTISPECIES: restriction endonuclease [Citromicrobium]|uniref:restriction endonuclease n=1 Tax=Citromicrobium TaxID=72173 RepID=UPI0001DD0A0D|nr:MULTISPECIES: restriction endonuclease [Citromicrobium]ALG60508.1 hypothetical protein WG74_06390 [Citromicrobium sp. JL477]
MSSLRPIDFRTIEELVEFVRGRGYVLDFSDATFSEFFAVELDVDIDDPVYAEGGTSKGKRLRCFLSKVDNATAARTLQALSEYRREHLYSTGNEDPVANAEGRLLGIIRRLNGETSGVADEQPKRAFNTAQLADLRRELYGLRDLAPQPRGYAFEDFLKRAFDLFGLKAREPFRNIGEQIDGSFLLDDQIYLLEAKWTRDPIGVADLHAFHGKLDKAAWTRGVFVSYGGFTNEGLTAFGSAKRMICVEGRDIYDALEKQIPLADLLRAKVRRAAETGHPFVPIAQLFP